MAERVSGMTRRAQPGPAARAVMALGHVLNPLLLPLVRTGLVPIWGVVTHRGRRSGRVYHTPVAVLAHADRFLIPLPFSERTDWCRNVLAAGGASFRWKGKEFTIGELQVIDTAASSEALGPLRPIVSLLGIRHFLSARRVAAR